MRVIYKYEIEDGLRLPRGAHVVRVAMQHNVPHVWAVVDADQAERDAYVVLPTGVPYDESRFEHVGTWEQGPYIWHLHRETSEVERGI